MEKEIETKTWADNVAEEVIRKKKEPFVVHGMWTPSGYFHIGNSRPEIFTPYSVRLALESKGHKVTQRFVTDDFDPVDKIPAGIPVKENEQQDYIGKPCYLAPSPFPGYKSWAEYFTREISEALPEFGIKLERVSAFEEYKQGLFNDTITFALNNAKDIVKIWTTIAKSQKQESFLPVQVLCPDCKKMTADITNWNGKTVHYKCTYCNSEGDIAPYNGNAKLHWRVHWVAHWVKYGVCFESGGKDHFSKGGSVDVGRALCEQVFKKEPPVQFPTEFIQLKGGAKMSGSAGNVISLKEWLSVANPELFRYMIFSHRPQSAIEFGLDDNSFVLLNENFERAQRTFYGKDTAQGEKLTEKIKREYELAVLEKPEKDLPEIIGFQFATLLAQLFDPVKQWNELEEVLISSGHVQRKLNEKERKNAQKKLTWVKHWVGKYAPAQFKVKFQENVPIELKKTLSTEMKACLQVISIKLNSTESADAIQQTIYETARAHGLKPGEVFKTLYQIIIGKDQGPRVGTLMHALGIEKVKKQLNNI